MGTLDDPRGAQVDALAYEAELADQRGEPDQARRLYAEAAVIEADIARSVPASEPRVRGLLAVSATALWYKASRHDEVERLACAFLADPTSLAEQARRELRGLMERAWREGELAQAIGNPDDAAPLVIKLEGGRIRAGLAPPGVIRDKQQIVVPLLVRIAQWRLGKPFRRATVAPADVREQIEIQEAPAIAASYGLRLVVLPGSTREAATPPRLRPREVVTAFLELAQAACQGSDALRAMVEGDEYRREILKRFRDLAPDGRSVGTVSFSTPSPRIRAPAPRFDPEHTQRLTEALRREVPEQASVTADGVLKVVSLRGRRTFIAVELANGGSQEFDIDPAQFAETIGPKVNRRVRVLGERVPSHRKRRTEPLRPRAIDVILLEESP